MSSSEGACHLYPAGRGLHLPSDVKFTRDGPRLNTAAQGQAAQKRWRDTCASGGDRTSYKTLINAFHQNWDRAQPNCEPHT